MPPPLAPEAKPFEDFHFPRRAVFVFGLLRSLSCHLPYQVHERVLLEFPRLTGRVCNSGEDARARAWRVVRLAVIPCRAS